MSKKMGKLINPSTGQMECKICGKSWWANLRGGGYYYHGFWQCPYGCKFEDKSLTQCKTHFVNVVVETPETSNKLIPIKVDVYKEGSNNVIPNARPDMPDVSNQERQALQDDVSETHSVSKSG